MKLNHQQIDTLRELAITAAQQAGAYIITHRPNDVQQKAGGSSAASQIVTEVDHAAQKIILDILLPTCERFDLALLTEESADDHTRFQKDYFWCIDPLDGTLPFVEGLPGFSVCIALVAKAGTPVIGVVYDPFYDVLYQATRGKGAFRNGEAFTTSSSEESSVLSLACDRSFATDPYRTGILKGLEAIASELGYTGVTEQTYGGAAINACRTIENTPACYIKFPKPQDGGGSLWDFSATACIAKEAGAIIYNSEGAPLDLNRPDSTFMNHQGILFASNQGLADKLIDLYRHLK